MVSTTARSIVRKLCCSNGSTRASAKPNRKRERHH
jgi:hypothetical protein